MATYSHTFSYDIEVPEVDTTMTTDIALTCTSDELRQVNEYLVRAKDVVAKRGPFTGEFKGLENIKGRNLPFTETKGKIEVRNHTIEAIPSITSLISGISSAVPEIGFTGKIYQVNAYFGKRIVYEVRKRPHNKTLEVEQHWDAVRPGDTYVPEPKITPSPSNSTKTSAAKKVAPVTFLTPADVVREFYARRNSHEEDSYTVPQLRLVSDALQGEPDYLMPDNRFDPMALVWLLQTRSIELRWVGFSSGRSWRIAFNDSTPTQAPTFHSNLSNVYGQAPFDILAYIDADEFAVPREWMHPNLTQSGVLPNGDFDMGNLLMLLSKGFLRINQQAESAYDVYCDDHLLNGVPDAPMLVARLLWMLRAYAGYRGPFDIEYKPMHDASLDVDIPPFVQACFGASGGDSSASLTVTDKPIPDLNGGEVEHPFDGGYGGYALREDQADFEVRLNDEALFVRTLLGLLESMPLSAELVGGAFADFSGQERMRLLPNDVLTLVSSWGRVGDPVDGDVVGIKAYSEEGVCVGVLKEPTEAFDVRPTDFGWRELACVLPYVTCVVCTVDKKADGVPATVELSFDTSGLSTACVIREARHMMRVPYSCRVRLSRGPLVASDLRSPMESMRDAAGRLYVPDEPNPAPADLNKPQGARPQLCENIVSFVGTEEEMSKLVGLMRANTLRPINQISGWYYDADELGRASSAQEIFQALRSDFAERLPYVFRRNPSAVYYRERHLLTMEQVGARLVLKIWFNTYDKPNNDDLAAFFKSLSIARLPVARVYKRADKREAHVMVDTFAKGKNSFGQMRRKEKVASLDQLAKRYEELGKQGLQNLDDLRLVEWAMLDEALGNGAHKVFNPENPAAHAVADAKTGAKASRYIAANGKVDAFAVADLLANDVVFFDPKDIVWRMGEHSLKGMRINRSAAATELGFVNHVQDYATGIADLFETLEQNEYLRVRKDGIHHSLIETLGDTDLTGMTLMQLMSWGRSLWIVGARDSELRESLALRAGVNLASLSAEDRERVYVIACDDRLLRGVPEMYTVLARLVDALRSYNGLTGPHVEVVVALRNEAADAYLKDFKGKVSRTLCKPTYIKGKLTQLASKDGVQDDTASAEVR